jgi:hypothetical protein
VIGRALGLKANILGFVSSFILYYYLLKIGYETATRKKIHEKEYVIYMFLFALNLPLVFFNGVRYPVGMILYVYGIYSFYYKNQVKQGIIYMLMGLYAHFSILLFIGIFIIFEFGLRKIKDPLFWKGLVVLGFVLGSNSQIMGAIILGITNGINNILGSEVFSVETYVMGKWGADRFSNVSPIEAYKQMIIMYLIKAVLILHGISRKADTSLYKFSVLISAIALFMGPFFTPFERFSKVAIILILVLNTNNDFLKKELNNTNAILAPLVGLITFVLFFEVKEEMVIFIESYVKNPAVSLLRIIAELII